MRCERARVEMGATKWASCEKCCLLDWLVRPLLDTNKFRVKRLSSFRV